VSEDKDDHPVSKRAGLFARLSKYVANGLRYWEPRRFVYNGVLAFVVVAHFLLAWPGSRDKLSFDLVLGLFLLAVLANIAYCTAYLGDLFLQFSGLEAAWRWGRAVLLGGDGFRSSDHAFLCQGHLWCIGSDPAAECWIGERVRERGDLRERMESAHRRAKRMDRPRSPASLSARARQGSVRWSVALAAIAALFCAAAQAQVPARPAADHDLARFTELESRWNDAHLRGDAHALERLWADDLRVVVPKMPPLTKADALSFLRSGRMKFSRYETSELGVRVYGDTAVVTGRLRRSRERSGQTVEDDWRFTKVYVRTNDAWRVVAYHASEAGP
jgi:ketosteroid isomerase-like protein